MTNGNVAALAAGDRVMAAVHTDRWMMGDRYGSVTKVTRGPVAHVRMDRSGKVVRFSGANLEHVA